MSMPPPKGRPTKPRSPSPKASFRPIPTLHTKVPTIPTKAERQRMVHPFLPTQSRPNLFGSTPPSSSQGRHGPPPPVGGGNPGTATAQEDILAFDDIIDAETGETLQPTKAVWSTVEGRLNFDRHTMLQRGTGALDIPRVDPTGKNLWRQDETPGSSVKTGRNSGRFQQAAFNVLSPVAGQGQPQSHHHESHHHLQHQHQHQVQSPQMNELVARFMRDGPLQLIHHKYYDLQTGAMRLPAGYVNDEDGDLDHYVIRTEESALTTGGQWEREGEGEGDDASVGMRSVTGHTNTAGSSSSSSISKHGASRVSSLGSSLGTSNSSSSKRETPEERKARFRREKIARLEKRKMQLSSTIAESKAKTNSPEEIAAEEAAKEKARERAALQADDGLGVNANDDLSATTSQLASKQDPRDEVLWHAIEERYYKEVCELAVAYEKNKLWTKEKRMPRGVKGMEQACRAYAGWRARSLKNLTLFIEEEQKRDVQRLVLEDSITNEAKLKQLIRKHDEERHQHRLFVRVSEYESEILTVRKLYDMGILW